jgi:hypothetical protein
MELLVLPIPTVCALAAVAASAVAVEINKTLLNMLSSFSV